MADIKCWKEVGCLTVEDKKTKSVRMIIVGECVRITIEQGNITAASMEIPFAEWDRLAEFVQTEREAANA